MSSRLKTRLNEEIIPALQKRFNWDNIMRAPRPVKIVLNMGVGEGAKDANLMDAAARQLGLICGQKPNIRRARKSISAFKQLRKGSPVGCSATLRGERMYEFLDRLISIALPRIRDFRGLPLNSFDGRGNYSFGVREQVIFPEIDYDSIDRIRGLDITIVTSAQTDEEARELLLALGMPFQESR
jgi:large subunit ribosomal protein L5